MTMADLVPKRGGTPRAKAFGMQMKSREADNHALPTDPTGPRRGRSVLLVDDESAWLADASVALAAAGYRVSTASTGQQAMGALRSASFDVLVVDQEMPHLPGLELIKFIRTNSPWSEMPAILLTTSSAADVMRKADRHGVRGVIEKSHLVLAELVAKVGDLLDADANADASAA